jgi:hypothetical protein
MEGYRTTQDLRTESASTEQLREAMIRYRALFEDLTGLREGPGEHARDRVAAIHDRAADRQAVAGDNARAAETAEPVTEARAAEDRVAEDHADEDRVAEDGVAEDRDLAARNDELATENASRTSYPPR